MSTTTTLSDWQILQNKLKERFGSEMDHDAILFMIGLQELDKPFLPMRGLKNTLN